MNKIIALILILIGMFFVPTFVFADKEAVVLMPLRVTNVDRSMLGTMEAAIVEGLQVRYKVFAGEQVPGVVKHGAHAPLALGHVSPVGL